MLPGRAPPTQGYIFGKREKGEENLSFCSCPYTYKESSDLTLTCGFRPAKKEEEGSGNVKKQESELLGPDGSQTPGVPVEEGAEPMSLLDSGSIHPTQSGRGLP